MKKILFFSLLLFTFLQPLAFAYQGTFEYLNGQSWTTEWTLYPSQAPPYNISAALYQDSTTGSTGLYVQNHWSSDYQSIILNEIQTLGYVSFILRDNIEDQYEYNCIHYFTIFSSNNAVLTEFYMYGIPDNRKIEIVPNGNYIDFYIDGTLRYSNVNPGITSTTPIKYGFRFKGGDNPGVKIDDFTTIGSIIGTPLIFTESISTFPVTWSAQLMRSYPDSNFNVSLYGITNLNNAGLIHSWSIPSQDNATTSEYGYFTLNRSQLLGLNYGLYMLEMTRDNEALTDSYFYYDNIANPLGYPSVLFIGSSDVETNILDEDNHGGDINAGGSVYLYPSVNENGIYDFYYSVLETPYDIKLILDKVYNNTALTGTNITISGLSGQKYKVSVDNTEIGSTEGADTYFIPYSSISWATDRHEISFSLDYTVPGVYGYVKNEATQTPIKSATVTVTNGTFTKYLTTDSNGMYYLTYGLVEGAYTVSAAKTGYDDSVPFNLTTTAGATTRQDIFLAKASGSGVYYAPHSVTFTVLEYWYDYAGLPGVPYTVYDNQYEEEIKAGSTDSKGKFTVKEMDEGINYTITLNYKGQNITEYIEPGLSEYTIILNKEGAIHTYVNNWLNLSYSQNSTNATVNYNSSKTITSASLLVVASNGTIAYSQNLATQNGTFYFTFSPGDYSIQFHILASDGSEASQAWTISNPVTVDLFPGSYPPWLKNTLFTAIVLLFLLAFGKSRNDVACGSVAVLTSFGYFFEWLTCSFNFVVLIWIVAFAGILLHYRRTGALG